MVRAAGILTLTLCLLCWLPAAPMAATPPQLRLVASNLVPWQGEEIVLTLEIRTTARPHGVMTPVWPLLDNCSGDDLVVDQPYLDDGRPAQLVQNVRRVVRPLRSGSMSFDGIGIRLHGKLLTAPPLTLRVRPLPPSGRPDGFAGAVGAVTMQLEASGRGTREVRLTLTAAAPVDDFPAPHPFLGDGEHLIPLSDESRGTSPGQRTRLLRYLYLPGEGRRGALAFSLPFFHPETGRYRIVRAAVDESYLRYAIALVLIVLAGIPTLLWLAHRLGTPGTVTGALQRILDTSPTGIPYGQILLQLRSRGVPPPLLEELQIFWSDRDRANFSPRPTDGAPRPSKRNERRLARRLLKAVDKRRPIP